MGLRNRNVEEENLSKMGDALNKEQEPTETATPTSEPSVPTSQASRPTRMGTPTTQAVKALPKQQKAGTGTFTNLKSYLEAARGGGGSKVSQAATQRIQNVAGQAQKGIQQAGKTFQGQLQAGSGALFQGGTTEQAALERAKAERERILGGVANITYQAPQTPETPPVQPTATTQSVSSTTPPNVPSQETISEPPVTPTETPSGQYFTTADQQAFANLINAQYQGPQSLQEAGLYEQAARKAQTAQQAIEQAKTAGGREQLLRDIFGRSRDYSRGASKLDALLLNTSAQDVQALQQQAEQAGNIQQQLQAAQNESANLAEQRARALGQISSETRGEFTKTRTAEEEAVEKRIDDLITTPTDIPKLDAKGKQVKDANGNPVFLTEWERLPAYFKDILNKSSKGAVKLSPIEMATLGIDAGEGLYNLRGDLIGTTAAERERLITKDELTRQLALQQLAGLDVSNQLQKDLKYTDLEKAGTQDLLSSLDTESIRKKLDEAQERFAKTAASTKITGKGKKKISRGNWRGKKTKTYYADVSGNVKKLLKQAGYDVSKDTDAGKSLLTDRDLLKNYLEATDTSKKTTGNGNIIDTIAQAGTVDAINPSSFDLTQDLLGSLGLQGASEVISGVRQGVADPFKGVANLFGSGVAGDLFRGIAGAIGGIDEGAMRAQGEATAKQFAIKDLQKKYADFLRKQGFENRIAASQDEKVLKRAAGLEELLRRKG